MKWGINIGGSGLCKAWTCSKFVMFNEPRSWLYDDQKQGLIDHNSIHFEIWRSWSKKNFLVLELKIFSFLMQHRPLNSWFQIDCLNKWHWVSFGLVTTSRFLDFSFRGMNRQKIDREAPGLFLIVHVHFSLGNGPQLRHNNLKFLNCFNIRIMEEEPEQRVWPESVSFTA